MQKNEKMLPMNNEHFSIFPLRISFEQFSKRKTAQKRQPLKQICEQQHTRKKHTEENNRNIVVYISPQQ